MPLNPIAPIQAPQHIAPLTESKSSSGAFLSTFQNALETVNQAQQSSHATIERFLSGENVELHQVALEQQRASLAFDMFLQVRNKVVQAYQEVMRMPL